MTTPAPTDTRTVSCPHGTACGACGLLESAYGEQLARKRDVVVEELQRFDSLKGVVVLPCLASPAIAGYRNRAKMAIEMGPGIPAMIGYFQEGTRHLVDALSCRVLVPEVLATTRALRDLLSQPEHASLPLRFIDVRCGSDPGAQHLTLVVNDATPLPLEAVRKACPAVTGISVNINPGSGPQVLRGAITLAWGERHVFVQAGAVQLRMSAGAFFQVNLAMLPLLHARLHAHFASCTRLADLYAGVGTHGLALHAGFERVLLIEGVTAAVRDAKTTMTSAAILNTAVFGAPVERALQRFRDERADAVVLNPSRDGAHADVLHAVAVSLASRVAYLSCEPMTLARDVDALALAGFKVTSVEPVDMMPQTRQVEALALLERPPQAAPERGGPARRPGRGRAGGRPPRRPPSPAQ